MKRDRHFAHWLLSLWLFAACGGGSSAPTQIIVEVDSDLSVPDELDRVTLSVDHAKAVMASADLTREPLPRTLGMVHSGGPMGPFTLHATGWLNDKVVVEAALEATFTEGKTVRVALVLDSACVDLVCADGETCSGGNCQPVTAELDGGMGDVDASTLSEAGVDGALADAGVPANVPTCVIEQPAPGATLQVGVPTSVRGRCMDDMGAVLSQSLAWRSDIDGMLATGANSNVTLQSAGAHVLSLCAPSPSDRTIIGCAMVSISAVLTAPPSAMITSSAQGATTRSPFNNASPIVFTGVGSGTGVSLSWSDSVQGTLGSAGVATLAMPLVGKHTVTLTVTDRSGRKANASSTFVVLAVGQTALIDSFAGGSAVLNSITALAERAPSVAYIGSSDGRLYTLNVSSAANTTQLALDRPPLQGNVQDLLLDAVDGLLYLATTSGLTVCSHGEPAGPSSCMSYQGGQIPNDNVHSVLRIAGNPSADRLLLGTEAGVFASDNAAGSSMGTVRLNERAVRDMAGDRNLVWLATDQGLYRYTAASGATMRVTSGAASNSSWSSLALGANGLVWLGGTPGLARYNASSDMWSFWKASDGLLSTQVTSLALEPQLVDGMTHDVVWIGTNAGVSRFDPQLGSFQSFTTADGLPSNSVKKLLVMTDGTKLFATDAGLARYSGR